MSTGTEQKLLREIGKLQDRVAELRTCESCLMIPEYKELIRAASKGDRSSVLKWLDENS